MAVSTGECWYGVVAVTFAVTGFGRSTTPAYRAVTIADPAWIGPERGPSQVTVLRTATAQVGLLPVTGGNACGPDRWLHCIPRISHAAGFGSCVNGPPSRFGVLAGYLWAQNTVLGCVSPAPPSRLTGVRGLFCRGSRYRPAGNSRTAVNSSVRRQLTAGALVAP